MKKFVLLIVCALLFPQVTFSNSTSVITLDPQGDDEYKLEFENRQAVRYKVPYITFESSAFKYGDNNDDLVFIEANFSESFTFNALNQSAQAGALPFNIGLRDYFVVSNSNANQEQSITHILYYNSTDTSTRTLSFDELGIGNREFTYEPLALPNAAVIGKATLVFGGNSYTAYVANATRNGGDNPLAIDMNADGVIDRKEIKITTLSGSILDLGNASESDGGNYLASQQYALWSNMGDLISGNTSLFTLLTKQGIISGFPTQDETVITTIERRPKREIGILDVVGSNFLLKVPPSPSTFFTTYGTDIVLTGSGNATTTRAETLTIAQALSLAPTMTIAGQPALGNTLNVTLSYRPHLGQQYYLMLALAAAPPYVLGDGRMIPLRNDSVMQSSLFTPNVIGLSNSQNLLDVQGNGLVSWNIPDVPGIVGYDVYLGFVTADTTKPMPEAVLAISPATKITLLAKQ